MKRKRLSMGILVVAAIFVLFSTVNATQVKLSGVPDYSWWYGCTPTSAGMMMGYYDRNGYAGLSYDNLVPGGVAELSSYVGGGSPLANSIMASPGHVNDFYKGGYLASGDDVAPPFHAFNSLADFMGTSQDSVGNVNGSTTLFYFTNGSPLTAQDAFNYGIWNSDGMYGMSEYFDYAGYGSGNPATNSIFTQQTGLTSGFTFANYKAEINEGRVVVLHVEGHTMLGYGYNDDLSTVYLHDTWSAGEHAMTWEGSYSGLAMWGVTCFTPTGGDLPTPTPEPCTVFLLVLGSMGLIFFRRRVS